MKAKMSIKSTFSTEIKPPIYNPIFMNMNIHNQSSTIFNPIIIKTSSNKSIEDVNKHMKIGYVIDFPKRKNPQIENENAFDLKIQAH